MAMVLTCPYGPSCVSEVEVMYETVGPSSARDVEHVFLGAPFLALLLLICGLLWEFWSVVIFSEIVGSCGLQTFVGGLEWVIHLCAGPCYRDSGRRLWMSGQVINSAFTELWRDMLVWWFGERLFNWLHVAVM